MTCRTFGWSGVVLRLEDCYVVPKYRGQGIGRAVLIHLAKVIKNCQHNMYISLTIIEKVDSRLAVSWPGRQM